MLNGIDIIIVDTVMRDGLVERRNVMEHPFFENDYKSSVAGSLILEAEKIRGEYRKKIQENGGIFNVFEILHKERREVGTHSNMLYSILSPKSEHTMGGKFLGLFIKQLGFPLISDDSWEIEREKPTPYGRIDFWLSSKKHHLCFAVEMKIDAEDQKKQLYRYDAYSQFITSNQCNSKSYFTDYRIFYLTLDGHAASGQSIHTMDKSKLINISFKREIANWLCECISLTPKTKKVYSAMLQYEDLIEKLVGESENMELVKLLHNKDRYRALKELQCAEVALKREFVIEFWDLLMSALPEGFEHTKHTNRPQDFYSPKGVVCLHYRTSKTFISNNVTYNYYVLISATNGKNECLWTGVYLLNAENDNYPKVKSKAVLLLEKLRLNDYFEDGYSDDYYSCCLGSNFIYSKDEDYYQFSDFSYPVINMLDNPSDDIDYIASQVKELINIIENAVD